MKCHFCGTSYSWYQYGQCPSCKTLTSLNYTAKSKNAIAKLTAENEVLQVRITDYESTITELQHTLDRLKEGE